MKTIALNPKNAELKTNDHYISALCNKTGLLISASLIAYFLVMKILNLHEIIALRYFNCLFLLVGILIAFNEYRKKTAQVGIDYLTGLKMGFQISLLAVVPFTLFMGTYLMLDDSFMGFVKHNSDFGSFLTPGVAAISILMEGLSSGAIITFIVMQYFKAEQV